jgi:thymidine phosphorylase
MISGRGLGHTGGTLDKLDSIPGYQSEVPLTRLRSTLHEAGCAIVGQTAELAPADRRLYAIRGMTATVESVPLITASILSKKLAAGLDALVLDVKFGNGAFATDLEGARTLAQTLVRVARHAGLPAYAWITDMNQVLGTTCGHALEVLEVLQVLQGHAGNERLLELTQQLATELLMAGGLADTVEQAQQRIDDAVSSGRALERFARMVAALGGPVDFVERAAQHLPAATVQHAVTARRAGFVTGMSTRDIGLLLIALGGGRRRAQDRIDPSVGLSELTFIGQAVRPGDTLAVVHAESDAAAEAAGARLQQLIEIGDDDPGPQPVLLHRI